MSETAEGNKNYFVYCHKNKINGKVYIGITNDLNRRWRSGNGYTNQPLFGNAISKYGWDNFEHQILECGLSFEEACQRERHYIELFKSNVYRYSDPAYGYNLTDGGQGFFGVDRSGEKNSFYNKHHSEHSKALMSAARTGSKNPFYGRKLSDAEIERLNGPKRKQVVCVETGKTFESATAAAKYLGVSHSSISSCCNGKCSSVKGLHFVYTDSDVNREIIPQRQNRWVICEDTGMLYMSTNKASKATGIGQASIWDCCNDRRQSNIAGDLRWRYATQKEICEFLTKEDA